MAGIHASDEETESRVSAIELDPKAGHYPELTRVLAYWDARRQGHFAPRRADIDPVDLRADLSRITLCDVFHTDPIDFRYRLCGTQICTTHVKDPTGRRPLDMVPPSFGQMLHAHYTETVQRRTPILHLIVLDTDVQTRSYARLILPLSEDRQQVTMLMTVDSKEQNTEALRAFFERASGL